jgi:heme/copper-type cytochrome/quinol oxidase subunit 4
MMAVEGWLSSEARPPGPSSFAAAEAVRSASSILACQRTQLVLLLLLFAHLLHSEGRWSWSNALMSTLFVFLLTSSFEIGFTMKHL